MFSRAINLAIMAHKNLLQDPEMVLLDIGANIGVFTVPAAARGHTVMAIEPFPPHLKLLKRSIEMNGLEEHVEIYEHGLSDGHYNMSMKVSVFLT